ncbi:hypothetical protein BV099_00750 [Haemophilus influenzae]|nr:hypothetical protein BV098_01025 [Haemophilus influenzae]PRL35662.1 hypothetical protein BV099_00750 [Haemophilus influenzae]
MVVNAPLFAVKPTVLLVIFATFRAPFFAVTVTAPFSALMSPLISPDWLEVVTLSVPLIVEPALVVNVPLFAVTLTVLPEILPTARVSPVAVSVTPPDLDSIPPLMSPVLAVTSTPPVVALMVVPSLVVTFPVVAEIFIVL